MSSIETKYNRLRHEINNGDIIIFRGSSLLSRTIQYFDNSYYNHTGLIFCIGSRLFIIDSNSKGVKPDFLSSRIKEYEDFTIVRPLKNRLIINEAVELVINKAELGIKYDYSLLLKIAVSRKIGKPIKRQNDNRDICSEFTGRRYASLLRINCYEEAIGEQGYITPGDHIKFIDYKELKTIF